MMRLWLFLLFTGACAAPRVSAPLDPVWFNEPTDLDGDGKTEPVLVSCDLDHPGCDSYAARYRFYYDLDNDGQAELVEVMPTAVESAAAVHAIASAERVPFCVRDKGIYVFRRGETQTAR